MVNDFIDFKRFVMKFHFPETNSMTSGELAVRFTMKDVLSEEEKIKLIEESQKFLCS